MLPTFADPKTDFVFKRIFGAEARRPLLAQLLNHLLELEGERRIVEGFEKRVVYNASKAYVMQLRNADEHPALCDVVGVTICNFNLWPEPEKDRSGHYKVPMLSRWRARGPCRPT